MIIAPGRVLTAALALGLTLTVSACGGSEPQAAADDKRAERSTEAAPTPDAPVEPKVAPATVAPTPTEEGSVRLFGQDGVESAYREIVDLATNLAFNPDWTLHDEDNEVTDLDPVLAGRFHKNQADHIRSQAEVCSGDDDTSSEDGNSEACGDVMASVYYDLVISDEDGSTLTYRPDGEFVTEQSITDPTVTTNTVEGQDGLQFGFDHTATVRMIADGIPVTATMTRHVTYQLWEAPAGNPTRWWIVNWDLDYQGSVLNETTGQPL